METRQVDDPTLTTLAAAVGEALSARGLSLVTAESCTGGWVAAAVTAVPGSSGWYERGFITYADAAKQEMLGVSAQTLGRHGAVSEATAREMAEGALRHSRGGVSVAVTGVAGPAGGTAAKPVGMVCFAWAGHGATLCTTRRFAGDRHAVRYQSVVCALQGILDHLAAGP